MEWKIGLQRNTLKEDQNMQNFTMLYNNELTYEYLNHPRSMRDNV